MSETHRCNEIENDLQDFKIQYANNGKELLRLVMAVENITKEVRDHHRFSEENKLRREKEEMIFKEQLKPILESYTTLINGRKWVLGIISFFFAIGSLYLLIKQIFKH